MHWSNSELQAGRTCYYQWKYLHSISETSEYTQVTKADNDALLEKFQAIIKAEVSTITKNSDTNTAEIKNQSQASNRTYHKTQKK